ncbi:MAG: hypothetical protein J5525_12130 [Lachnospiraceae bacterium]|nr:hypothetical protein [Lachnospiraceae bacterium]
MKTIKESILETMDCVFQNPYTRCDYDIVCDDTTIKLKNTSAIDAYMRAVEEHEANQKPTKCYMRPSKTRAAEAIFTIDSEKITLSGLEINRE